MIRANIGKHIVLFIVTLLGAGLAPVASVPQELDAEAIGNTRSMLEQWVETERLISKEKRDLQLAREMLNERISLVQSEIDSLREKIGEAESSIEEADKRRESMIQENEELKQATSLLDSTLITLEKGTRSLVPRLPDPIRERIRPLTQRLPENPETSERSTSERFQNIVGILNEIDKFNLDITMTSEVRSLPDGSSAEVTALYLGIGYAFYVGANNTVAGTGTSSGNGWVWTPMNEYAVQIEQAIAILENEQVAGFVPLPVTLK